VRVVVADRAVHLAQKLHARDARARTFKAHGHVGELLAHGGGRGALAVGAAEHGHGGVLARQLAQAGDDGIQRG